MEFQIRVPRQEDLPAIFVLAREAFGAGEGGEIADLIGDLVADKSAQPLVSLVATKDQAIIGHVAFSSAGRRGVGCELSAMLLAPLAVHPDFQSKGVGSRLVEEGMRMLAEAGVDLVFVLGHPGYYPRFGFVEAGANGLEAPYPIAPENAAAWMVYDLRPGPIEPTSGRVRCADSLDDPKYWVE